jgi:hypothetical protein
MRLAAQAAQPQHAAAAAAAAPVAAPAVAAEVEDLHVSSDCEHASEALMPEQEEQEDELPLAQKPPSYNAAPAHMVPGGQVVEVPAVGYPEGMDPEEQEVLAKHRAQKQERVSKEALKEQCKLLGIKLKDSDSSVRNGPKIPSPQKFSGNDSEVVEDYIFTFENYLRASGVPTSAWPSYVLNLLTGKALNAWLGVARPLQAAGTVLTWELLLQTLLTTFPHHDLALAARKKLHAVEQSGRVADYLQLVRTLVSRAGAPATSDTDLLLIFWRGLKQVIRDQAKVDPRTGSWWASFEDLAKHCVAIDTAFVPKVRLNAAAVKQGSSGGKRPPPHRGDEGRGPKKPAPYAGAKQQQGGYHKGGQGQGGQSRGGRQGGRGDRDRASPLCTICNNPGHWASHCKMKQPPPPPR